MLYDISVTPEQIAAVAEWATAGMADVELLVDDRMLLAEQGDERMAWDTGGEPATDVYLKVAPLDPRKPATVWAVTDSDGEAVLFWVEQDAIDYWHELYDNDPSFEPIETHVR